jgi:hypothetical protein
MLHPAVKAGIKISLVENIFTLGDKNLGLLDIKMR